MDFNTALTIIGVIAAIAAIPITFFLGRRTRQRPELRHAMDFDVLLRPTDRLFDEGLYMTLEDRKIDSISRTRLALWNQRGDTIRGTDVLGSDPLRLQFPSGDSPLQTRVICMSRKQTALSGAIDLERDASVIINFYFLDPGDGGVVEVIHQGIEKPTITGTIRGAITTSRGSTDLAPDTLLDISEKSRTRRILKSFRRNWTQWGVALVATLFAIGTYVLLESSGQGRKSLIDASR